MDGSSKGHLPGPIGRVPYIIRKSRRRQRMARLLVRPRSPSQPPRPLRSVVVVQPVPMEGVPTEANGGEAVPRSLRSCLWSSVAQVVALHVATRTSKIPSGSTKFSLCTVLNLVRVLYRGVPKL